MSGFITLHKPTYGDPVLVSVDRIATVAGGQSGYSYVTIDGRTIGLEVRESLAEIEKLIEATNIHQEDTASGALPVSADD